ncbi:MAG TPA: divergent polysaccharide deacetylase family protein [Acidiferrobacterales bacterium]|nr:divergent polysaccharide deacetylase family protein [Acidiferrobacterales bacterium]
MSRVTLLFLLVLTAVPAASAAGEGVTIGIIIDDLGNNLANGERAARLPGAVACAVLPHTPFARSVANAAHAAGKEVMLHLPMASQDAQEPGPGQLDAGMPPLEMRATLDYDLSTVPHVIGVNNHMGSLLTTQPGAMDWLMRELAQRRLFFVDSRTDAQTVAADAARRVGVPALERHVFLDDDPVPAAVAAQLERLEQLARRHGYALAIGHPHPVTLAALERWLPQLAERGIQLIPLTSRLARHSPEAKPWRASWSH